jgi:hypothetical protein
VRILDRDLVAAGIARWAKDERGRSYIDKRDERGRTVDVHALRTTFGTHLSKSGVAPRTAQAAMRHSDIKLTMGVYTDPKLLDVAGALEGALPSLPLDGEPQAQKQRATGTAGAEPPSILADAPRITVESARSLVPDHRAAFPTSAAENKDLQARTLVPRLVPTLLNRGDSVAIADKMTDAADFALASVNPCQDKRKTPLTTAVNGGHSYPLGESNPCPLAENQIS